MKATLGARSSSATPPVLQMSKRGDGGRRVRDCGMKLTMDGKLSRREVRKREKRGRKGEKSCQKGNEKRVNWKEFSANGGRQRGREGEAATFN